MKTLITSILVTGCMGLAATAHAQNINSSRDDSMYRQPPIKDSALLPRKPNSFKEIPLLGGNDSARSTDEIESRLAHGLYVAATAGLGCGILGGTSGDIVFSAGFPLDLSFIFGKNVIDLSYENMSAGSITVGSTNFLLLIPVSSPPTVPEKIEQIIAASYGQRITPIISWTAGLAYVNRTQNIPTGQESGQGSVLFGSVGTYSSYITRNDAYVALPVSLVWNWGGMSIFGAQLKAQLMLSYAEVSGNISFSLGLGGLFSGSQQ